MGNHGEEMGPATAPNRNSGGRTVLLGGLLLLLTAVLSALAFYVWLGWDQQRDVHPDGSTTGPYEAWQVIGLVVVLTAIGGFVAWHGHPVAAMLGVTIGLTGAVSADWSDDTSGLWVVGAAMVCVGTLLTGAVVTSLIAMIRKSAH